MIAILAARGIQSALEPAGAHADRVGDLWNVFLGVTAVVYVVVMIVLFIALLRRRQFVAEETPRGTTMVVSVAVGITVVILFGLLISSIFVGRSIADIRRGDVQIEITAHQWWWQVDYPHPNDQSKRFTGANEITIPVGVPVRLKLHSSDVIHSFWVPNLHGKQDLIPGHDDAIILKADRPGVYRGQCAEFCGTQHAKMSLWVNAVAPSDYARWADTQRKPSKIPSTDQLRKGQDVFMTSPCPLCHTIQGTSANGKTAPDLTHFASRRSIAAGTVPNRRGYLAGWILDPQHIKAGAQMPPMLLEQKQLEPLLAYLESLE